MPRPGGRITLATDDEVIDVVPLSDPRIAAIPVHETGEPLVDLRVAAPLRIDPRQADPAGAYAHLRTGVVDRLVTAQSLLPRRTRLLIIEGYRPLALQRRYFEEYTATLRQDYPHWTPAQVRERVSHYIAPPEVAPHVAGAAVDLTLVTVDGQELFMGTEVNASPEESAGACHTEYPDLPAAVRHNRDLLASTLTAAGLRNYPTEWWHWSYGDRYWAFLTGGIARYGPVARLP